MLTYIRPDTEARGPYSHNVGGSHCLGPKATAEGCVAGGDSSGQQMALWDGSGKKLPLTSDSFNPGEGQKPLILILELVFPRLGAEFRNGQ